MAAYRLTAAAVSDITSMFLEGLEQFGLPQADRYHQGLAEAFDFLAQFPRAARAREELHPPVRIYPYQSHLIIYELEPDDRVLILRVRHGREDWLMDMAGDIIAGTPDA
jgi:toxin ParE1/3/4